MSSYKYVHDATKQIVYRFPVRPQVIPKLLGQGRRKKPYHYVTMVIDIVRADNKLEGHRWKFPTSDHPHFTYDDRYNAEDAADYFMLHYAPRGEMISLEEYEKLAKIYGATL